MPRNEPSRPKWSDDVLTGPSAADLPPFVNSGSSSSGAPFSTPAGSSTRPAAPAGRAPEPLAPTLALQRRNGPGGVVQSSVRPVGSERKSTRPRHIYSCTCHSSALRNDWTMSTALRPAECVGAARASPVFRLLTCCHLLARRPADERLDQHADAQARPPEHSRSPARPRAGYNRGRHAADGPGAEHVSRPRLRLGTPPGSGSVTHAPAAAVSARLRVVQRRVCCPRGCM